MCDVKFLVVGWPRSGTSWLERLLAHYLDGPAVKIWVHADDGDHPCVDKLHDPDVLAITDDTKIILSIRDPRDTAVSEYFFLDGKAHSIPDTSLHDYLKDVFWKRYGGWRAYIRRWSLRCDVVTHHESLWEDRKGELRRILCVAGIMPDEECIQHAANASLRFDGVRPTYIKEENWRDSGQVALSGQPGEWKRHFTPRAARFMEEYCGDMIDMLGYGGEAEWTELLSR